jgi:Tfp pilus assembly protein PilX
MDRPKSWRRRGSALLLVLFLMAVTTPLICFLLEVQIDRIRCAQNHIEAQTALYAAHSGVHDAMSELLANAAWRAGFTNREFPVGSGNTYTVTLGETIFAGEVVIIITSTGTTAQGSTKTVQATVSGFSGT